MDAWIIAQMCGELCAKGGFDATPQREPIRAWTLSGVERVRFADGATAIFKFAAEPFTSEDRALSFVGSRGVPVPTLYASAVHHRILGMVMEDLGPHTRDATDADGAIAAALLHAVGNAPDLAVYNTAVLRELPERALRHLRALTDAGRWPDTTDIADALWTLRAAAPLRSAGTEKAPFGLCHSEFHPTSLHVSESGWRLLDFARAFNGPGLLDLASWHGTLDPADPTRLRGLIES